MPALVPAAPTRQSSAAPGRRVRRIRGSCPKHASGLYASPRSFSARSRGPKGCTGAGRFTDRVTTPTHGPGVDPNSGLIYLRARWYDPRTGQFISQDPLEAQTQQPYSYAGDDPTNNTDPSGLFCIPFAGCGFSIGFYPMAGVDALVNIGRGASFGLSDDIANWISPGASCTVPDNPLDRALGAAGVGLVAGGGSAERIISSWLGSKAAEAASDPGILAQILEATGHEIPSVARAAAAKPVAIGLTAYAVSSTNEGSCGCSG